MILAIRVPWRLSAKETACQFMPMQETGVWSLGWEDPLEEEMAAHSSILAWDIPWTEGPGGLQALGSQRVRHNLVTKQQQTKWFQEGLCSLDLPIWMWLNSLFKEKAMATHSSVLAWRIPGTEEPGVLLSVGSHRVRHGWSNLAAANSLFKAGPLLWDGN